MISYRQLQFVRGGHKRAVRAISAEITLQVAAEYADRLRLASLWQRSRLRRKMRREVRRRIDELAPPDALY